LLILRAGNGNLQSEGTCLQGHAGYPLTALSAPAMFSWYLKDFPERGQWSTRCWLQDTKSKYQTMEEKKKK